MRDHPALPSRRRLLAAAGAAALLSACGEQEPKLRLHGIDLSQRPGFGGDFRLSDPDGRERTLSDFYGRAVLLFFGFTLCPDVCPTALTRAAQIRKLLGADGQRLQVLFVTLDPERDTPQVLRAYTQAFDPSFIGLSGSEQRIAETAKAFRVVYAKVPTGSTYTIDHSALSYVYDARGRLRMALRHEQSAAECVDDIRQIL
ncbi:SCO family protein [Lysobacter yananisis]|uniref:SCO family protein n=1 Tax=Lysobacter yananisis TaxID=1003114 RepID=A0ABY9PCC9_9GAMM|nr:SCO family protein [Lysobacter yananisis]WMT04733.1 SCO family protein [Lysobacter yananisis]